MLHMITCANIRCQTGSVKISSARDTVTSTQTASQTWIVSTAGRRIHGVNIPSTKPTGGLVTLAERVSRYLLAGHILSKHVAGVTAVTKRLLHTHKEIATPSIRQWQRIRGAINSWRYI